MPTLRKHPFYCVVVFRNSNNMPANDIEVTNEWYKYKCDAVSAAKKLAEQDYIGSRFYVMKMTDGFRRPQSNLDEVHVE